MFLDAGRRATKWHEGSSVEGSFGLINLPELWVLVPESLKAPFKGVYCIHTAINSRKLSEAGVSTVQVPRRACDCRWPRISRSLGLWGLGFI